MPDPPSRIQSGRLAVLLGSILLVTIIAGVLIIPATAHVGGSGGVSVRIVETNAPVAEGDTLNVTVELENTAQDSHTIRGVLYVAGEVRDSETANLRGGESTTATLTWETQAGDAGDYEAAVEVGEDYDTTDVSIRTPANLAIDINETNSPIVEGEALAVTATVQNSGGMPVMETVSLVVGDEIRDTTTVSVDGNANQTVTLTWPTANGDAGTYDISVDVGNASSTVSIGVEAASENESVNKAPTARIRSSHEGGAVDPGTTIQFEADASDPDGEVVSYEWRVDGDVVSTERTISYTFDDAGTHEVRLIVTDDDGSPTAVTRTIEVATPDTSTETTTTLARTTSGASGQGFGVLIGLAALLLYGYLRAFR